MEALIRKRACGQRRPTPETLVTRRSSRAGSFQRAWLSHLRSRYILLLRLGPERGSVLTGLSAPACGCLFGECVGFPLSSAPVRQGPWGHSYPLLALPTGAVYFVPVQRRVHPSMKLPCPSGRRALGPGTTLSGVLTRRLDGIITLGALAKAGRVCARLHRQQKDVGRSSRDGAARWNRPSPLFSLGSPSSEQRRLR